MSEPRRAQDYFQQESRIGQRIILMNTVKQLKSFKSKRLRLFLILKHCENWTTRSFKTGKFLSVSKNYLMQRLVAQACKSSPWEMVAER